LQRVFSSPARLAAFAARRACKRSSTSTISARRESSEPRICCSRVSSGRQSCFDIAYPCLDPAHLEAISINWRIGPCCDLTDRGDIALSFAATPAAFLCCVRVARVLARAA